MLEYYIYLLFVTFSFLNRRIWCFPTFCYYWSTEQVQGHNYANYWLQGHHVVIKQGGSQSSRYIVPIPSFQDVEWCWVSSPCLSCSYIPRMTFLDFIKFFNNIARHHIQLLVMQFGNVNVLQFWSQGLGNATVTCEALGYLRFCDCEMENKVDLEGNYQDHNSVFELQGWIWLWCESERMTG